MTQFSAGNVPGFQPKLESSEAQVWWSGREGQHQLATRKISLDASNTDAGNSPNTTLRSGTLLAIDDATGKAFVYDPDANNGRQIVQGVLDKSQDMLLNGTPSERFTQMLVTGLLKQGELVGLDPRAIQQLAGRFVFDANLTPPGVLMHPRGVYRKSANTTLTAADNGLLFVATAAVNFTLPAKQNGLAFRFAQTADADLVLTGTADLVHKGNAAANTVSFATAGQKIGSQALVECIFTADNILKWIVTNLGGTTATVA